MLAPFKKKSIKKINKYIYKIKKMNIIKTSLFLLLMFVFFLTIFIVENEVYIQILTSLAIVSGALSLKSLSAKILKENE